jgi:hypothetical protein
MSSLNRGDGLKFSGNKRCFLPVGGRDDSRPKMAEMPEARLNRACVDTHKVAIMLLRPNFLRPFPGGPGAFWKPYPHPAGRASRCQWGPALADMIEFLLSKMGSVSSGHNRGSSAGRTLLNNLRLEGGSCFRDGACLPNELPPSPSRKLSLFRVKLSVFGQSIEFTYFNLNAAHVEPQPALRSFGSLHCDSFEESPIEGM